MIPVATPLIRLRGISIQRLKVLRQGIKVDRESMIIPENILNLLNPVIMIIVVNTMRAGPGRQVDWSSGDEAHEKAGHVGGERCHGV